MDILVIVGERPKEVRGCLWDLCNDQLLFHQNHSAGRISCSPIQNAGAVRGVSMWIVWYSATIGSLSAFDSVSTVESFAVPDAYEDRGKAEPLIMEIDGM
jgi:hypothetical protein